jgi:ABC-type sugar transport system permease subunit
VLAPIIFFVIFLYSLFYILGKTKLTRTQPMKLIIVKFFSLFSLYLFLDSNTNPLVVDKGPAVSLFDTFVALLTTGTTAVVETVFAINKNILGIFTSGKNLIEGYFTEANNFTDAMSAYSVAIMVFVVFIIIALIASFFSANAKRFAAFGFAFTSLMVSIYTLALAFGVFTNNAAKIELAEQGATIFSRNLTFAEQFEQGVRYWGYFFRSMTNQMELHVSLGILVMLIIAIPMLIFSISYLRKSKLFEITMYRRQIINGYLFISPWLFGFLFFYFFNVIQAVRFSFSEVTIIPTGGYTMLYTGWENFINLFRIDPSFTEDLYTAMAGILYQTPMIIFFSLFIAILLNRKFKGRFVVRAIFFLPILLTSPLIIDTIARAVEAIYGGPGAVPDGVATSFGASGTGFSVDLLINTLAAFNFPMQFLDYVVAMVESLFLIVRLSGVQILIFLAALQSIPSSLYEVAQIEGSTAYETFWKITLPLVSPLILTNTVYTIVDLYSVTPNVVERARTEFFSNMQLGFSSAMTVSSSAIMCLMLIVIGYAISRKVFYYV